ncbi:MAG: DUF1338 family protein [Planctomycetota bacterium]|nr:DUF1338 family protein [Planctomycetota bacterium]
MKSSIADKILMQHRLFSELSRMFGLEVPLYDKSLLVNQICNRTVCDLLAILHHGFTITDGQLERTSGERHGAIRIGKPEEYRWVTRFFAAFAMEPHNYYDMSNVGAKSQPILATAFRACVNPEHRVFTSLLQTDYFDPETRQRIEALLATRQVFTPRSMELIEQSEREGGLSWADAEALIREGADHIFKWKGTARDHQLYQDLCKAGFKIAADIACFESHHLNHLTPNTFCMDLYTAAMKYCLGELSQSQWQSRAQLAMAHLCAAADGDFMCLHFKHLSHDQIDAFTPSAATSSQIAGLIDALSIRLSQPDLKLAALKHAGFKDTTEGPPTDTPVLLRQDAYKALTEPVVFRNHDGTTIDSVHTARFGEIEQRFYATTPSGRALYNSCLADAETAVASNPGVAKSNFVAYQTIYAKPFSAFPKTLRELAQQDLVYCRYSPTAKGLAAKGTLRTADIKQLIKDGFVRYEGLRYEDFLPVSAAGIFASNLNQYGTKSTAASKPVYRQETLEAIMGKPIIDADTAYREIQSLSLRETLRQLGLPDSHS